MITAKMAMQVTVGSPLGGIDQLKKGVIINGRTGEVEQAEGKTPALEAGSFRDRLLKRADEVVDTVSISRNFVHA